MDELFNQLYGAVATIEVEQRNDIAEVAKIRERCNRRVDKLYDLKESIDQFSRALGKLADNYDKVFVDDDEIVLDTFDDLLSDEDDEDDDEEDDDLDDLDSIDDLEDDEEDEEKAEVNG